MRSQAPDPPLFGAFCTISLSGGERPLGALSSEEATAQALRFLTCAAEFDSATGGANPEANLYPVVKLVTQAGVQTIPEQQLKALYEDKVVRHV